MTGVLDLGDPRTRAAHDGLGAYARLTLERAARHALRLHADAVSLEHLFTSLMADEDSAAHRAIVFGFGDPPTLAAEAMALSPGILVVGSTMSLPFSPLGVRALFAARADAAAEGAPVVDPGHLFVAAIGELDADAREGLEQAGYDPTGLRGREEYDDTSPVGTEGALFARFDTDARRTLGFACRVATRSGEDAIAPGHIVRACLDTDAELARRAGVEPRDFSRVLAGRDADHSQPEARSVPIDETAAAFLGQAPTDAGTLELLAAFCHHGPDELVEILRRNRIGVELIERAAPAYHDPTV